MQNIHSIKNSLIDKILAIQSVDFLSALNFLIDSCSKESVVTVSQKQKNILLASEEDIKYGRVKSQEDLHNEDMALLNSLE